MDVAAATMGITSIVFGLHTELSDSVQTVCFALFCVDLFGQLVLLALSIFVTDVVRRCAALHDNLKVSRLRGRVERRARF